MKKFLTGQSVIDSELKDHVFVLIYELHLAHCDMLLYILPTLVELLQVEDQKTRLRVVVLLGIYIHIHLFCSP